MLGGILAGAIQGGGQAMQQNAQGQIEEKRQRALAALDQEMAFERDDRQFEREKEMTQEERLIEERRRKEDRAWDIQSNEANRAHETQLADIRASSGGGRGGYAPGGIEKDIEYFRSQGYSPEEAQERALLFRGRGGDPLGQLGDSIDRMGEVLENDELLYQLPEEEVDQLRADYLAAQRRYREMSQRSQGLISGAQNDGGGNGGGGSDSGEGDDYPQEGDMVGNPSSGASGSWGGGGGDRSPSRPTADDIANQFNF